MCSPSLPSGSGYRWVDSLKCWDLALDLALIAEHASPESLELIYFQGTHVAGG